MSEDAYPLPTDATIRRLYGSAFRCAHPECNKPLYRLTDDTGDRVLNSRVAHIHARRRGGPRWIEMLAEDNRAFENLVLLCIDHSYEIDEFPESFPADTLRDWKAAQIAEYDRLQRNWPINDEEAAEVLATSEGFDKLRAPSTLELVRRIEALKLIAERTRNAPKTWARTWHQVREQAQKSVIAWDDQGKPLHVEPSAAQIRPIQDGLRASLNTALAELTPAAEAARAELAAVQVTRATISPWSDAVGRAISGLTDAASTWTGGPDPTADAAFDNAVSGLVKSLSSLVVVSRGQTESLPAVPPDEPQLADVDPHAELARLLDEARPFARVDHLPYDPELRERVAAATHDAATIPPTMTFLSISLTTTAGLAIDVAANASQDQKLELLDRDRRRTPTAAAAALLQEAARDSDQRGDTVVAAAAREQLGRLWSDTDWATEDAWLANEVHGRSMMYAFARATSDEEVRATLSAALTDSPELCATIVVACAGWRESRDSHTFEVLGISRNYGDIPPWLPIDAIALASQSLATGSELAPEDLLEVILRQAAEGTE